MSSKNCKKQNSNEGFYSEAVSIQMIALPIAKWLSWYRYWFYNNGEFKIFYSFRNDHNVCEIVTC